MGSREAGSPVIRRRSSEAGSSLLGRLSRPPLGNRAPGTRSTPLRTAFPYHAGRAPTPLIAGWPGPWAVKERPTHNVSPLTLLSPATRGRVSVDPGSLLKAVPPTLYRGPDAP